MDVLKILMEFGALLDGHYVYKSGKHGPRYINKSGVTSIQVIDRLCSFMATRALISNTSIEVVVGPATGGISLAALTARKYAELVCRDVDLVYTEKVDGVAQLRRGFDQKVGGRSCLVVEDIVNEGTTVRDVVSAIRRAQGTCEVVTSWVSRNGQTAKTLGVEHFFPELEIEMASYLVPECEQCAQGVPVNTDFGHGAAFLASS